jgi:hypothetical protein
MHTAVIDLPSFDTGEYEGCELHMNSGDATLSIHVAGRESFIIKFTRVRWHRFTSLYACEPEWISGYYFRVAEVPNSVELRAHLKADRATIKPYKELHHYRILLDETGCHEFFAERADAL